MAAIQVACSAIFMFYILNIVQSNSYSKIQIADDIMDPGVFKYLDNFYMVGRNGNRIILKSSKDLLTWKIESNSLLGGDLLPKWVERGSIIISPEIHLVQSKFNLYFYANHFETNKFSIGVATADTVLGPYRDIGRPLLAIDNLEISRPHIAHEGTCILYSRSYKNDRTELSYMHSHDLFSLSLSLSHTHTLSLSLSRVRLPVLNSMTLRCIKC